MANLSEATGLVNGAIVVDTRNPITAAKMRAVLGAIIDATRDELALKANLNSPALTGTPRVPLAPLNDNTTTAASTSFVARAVTTAISGPGVKAFVSFLGATGAIESALGVTSVTRNGVGDYTIFGNFPANVSVIIGTQAGGTNYHTHNVVWRTTSQIRITNGYIRALNEGMTPLDGVTIFVAVFGV